MPFPHVSYILMTDEDFGNFLILLDCRKIGPRVIGGVHEVMLLTESSLTVNLYYRACSHAGGGQYVHGIVNNVLWATAQDWRQQKCPSKWDNEINRVHLYYWTTVWPLKRIWTFCMCWYTKWQKQCTFICVKKNVCIYAYVYKISLEGATRNY